MKVQSSTHLPVVVTFPPSDARQESWGRLVRLSAVDAKLSTLCDLRSGQRLRLTFEVNGEPFLALRCKVSHSEIDDDGYCLAELDFEDQLDRRRLAKALGDLLSR